MKNISKFIFCLGFFSLLSANITLAQDTLPEDNTIYTYHSSPRYRESESHPLRIIGYILHPIGWALREGIFRPLSYLVSSTEESRSIFGFREPFDYRQPECFTSEDSTPDCKSLLPFNYDQGRSNSADSSSGDTASLSTLGNEVYFPNINFDSNKSTLNALGRGRTKQVAQLLSSSEGAVKVVLQGHADNRGSDSYNKRLGMSRAESVRDELVNLGISAERLSTVSFGESQPLEKGDSDWARAVNRRVEVQAE